MQYKACPVIPGDIQGTCRGRMIVFNFPVSAMCQIVKERDKLPFSSLICESNRYIGFIPLVRPKT